MWFSLGLTLTLTLLSARVVPLVPCLRRVRGGLLLGLLLGELVERDPLGVDEDEDGLSRRDCSARAGRVLYEEERRPYGSSWFCVLFICSPLLSFWGPPAVCWTGPIVFSCDLSSRLEISRGVCSGLLDMVLFFLAPTHG